MTKFELTNASCNGSIDEYISQLKDEGFNISSLEVHDVETNSLYHYLYYIEIDSIDKLMKLQTIVDYRLLIDADTIEICDCNIDLW